MSLSFAQHNLYMADAARKRAESYDYEAKAAACDPLDSPEGREAGEAFYMNLAFDARVSATYWAELALEEMREKAA